MYKIVLLFLLLISFIFIISLCEKIYEPMEISFNDDLDKNFVKDLSTKLLEWTNKRWIISFSKNKGEISIKEKETNKKKELITNAKKTNLYKTMLDYFPDAELIDVKTIEKKDE